MDQIKVGAFLKDLRKEKEITQEQLAEELGVSGRTIRRSSWLRNWVYPAEQYPDGRQVKTCRISACWLR